LKLTDSPVAYRLNASLAIVMTAFLINRLAGPRFYPQVYELVASLIAALAIVAGLCLGAIAIRHRAQDRSR
jgi:hypothetical protein